MADDSVLFGRIHTTAQIDSFVHEDRWPFWYRRRKPDHNRSNADNYQYPVVNAEAHSDIEDQHQHPYTYSGHFFERVDDNPAIWESMGQSPIKIHSVSKTLRVSKDMQILTTRGLAIVTFDYKLEIDDRIIQLDEDVDSANRIEWKVNEVRQRGNQYWSASLQGMVGVYG